MRSRPHKPACMHAGMRGEDHEQFLLEAPWQPFAVLNAWLALTPGEILRCSVPIRVGPQFTRFRRMFRDQAAH